MTTRTTVAVVLVLVAGGCAGDASGERDDDLDVPGRSSDGGVIGPLGGRLVDSGAKYPTAAWRCECVAFLSDEDAAMYRAGVNDPNLTTGTQGGRQAACADSLEGVIEEAEKLFSASHGDRPTVCQQCCPQPDLPFEQTGMLATCLADEPGECDGRLCPGAPAECKPL